jgi:hypothetical protein
MANDIKEEIRKRYLKNLITEVVTIALFEQDQQQAQQMLPPPPAANAPATAQEMQQLGAPAPDNQVPPVQPPPQMTAEQITLDMLIERLNIVRGGKSFTDPEVYGQMTSYFKSMPPAEKDSVYRFLLQVAKIVTSNTQEQTGQQDQSAPQPEVQNSAAPTPPPAPQGAPTAPTAPPIQAQQAL